MNICVIVLFMVVHINAYQRRSFAECDNQSGEVFYDPETKVCKCDRRQCFSRRNPPGVHVKEENCVRLEIFCGKGMQPNSIETQCVVCPEGKFKDDQGCEWCVLMTTCSDTEWTVFNGNRSSDRICSVKKPEVPGDTTVTYPQQPSSTQQRLTPTTTTTQIATREVVKDAGSTLLADFFDMFCSGCGLILIAVVLFAGLKEPMRSFFAGSKKQSDQNTNDDVERKEGQTGKDGNEKPREKNQTYIHQVDEDKRPNGQTPTEVGGVHTVGQTLVIGEEEVIPKVCANDHNIYNGDDPISTNTEYSALDFSSVLNDKFTLAK